MENIDRESDITIQHVATDCEGAIRRSGSREKLPDFLGTRVGVVISYVGAQAVRVNCPFNAGGFCTNKPADDKSENPCHRVDNVLEGGYKFSDRDVGAAVYPINKPEAAYRVVKIEDGGEKLILQRVEDGEEAEVAMVRSGEYENVYISGEPLPDGDMLVLQVVRLSDGRADFMVFKDADPY